MCAYLLLTPCPSMDTHEQFQQHCPMHSLLTIADHSLPSDGRTDTIPAICILCIQCCPLPSNLRLWVDTHKRILIT